MNDNEINLKRELRYQVMRSLRLPFNFVYLIAVPLMCYFLIVTAVNSWEMFHYLILNTLTDPATTVVGRTYPGAKYISEALGPLYSIKPLIARFSGDGFKFAMLALISAICYGVFIPYSEMPNMPTFKIRTCKHCGAKLPNHVFLRCGECHHLFPSGFALAIIRAYGYGLTVVSFALLGICLILF